MSLGGRGALRPAQPALRRPLDMKRPVSQRKRCTSAENDLTVVDYKEGACA
jgi:hypothetical protein